MAYGNGGAGAISGGDSAYGRGVGNIGVADMPRMPLISLEMDRQAKAIEHLHSLISDLEARMSAVLRPVPPDVANVVGKPVMTHQVPLAEGLCGQNLRVESACQRIQSLFERVEL